jgi:hypothetical protein
VFEAHNSTPHLKASVALAFLWLLQSLSRIASCTECIDSVARLPSVAAEIAIGWLFSRLLQTTGHHI